jgi:hypothetical protein
LSPTGTPNEYDVAQVEGSVSQVGVPYSDTNMNEIDFNLYLMANTFSNTSGTDAYAINIAGVISYTQLIGIPLKFITSVANTGACSLNVTGLGAKNMTKDVSIALETGDIIANSIVMVVYDGTQFQIMEMNGLVTKNGGATLTNKRLTAPTFASGGYIADVNGYEMIRFVAGATPVNDITFYNAPTNSAPTIAASGDDANISLNLVPKGTGNILANGNIVGTVKGAKTVLQTITAVGAGNYTVPAGVYQLEVVLISGGGGGGAGGCSTGSAYSGGGGGSAGFVRNITNMKVSPGQVIPYTVGAGGTGPAGRSTGGTGASGGQGGTTSFNGLVCVGGSGSPGGSTSSVSAGTISTALGGGSGVAPSAAQSGSNAGSYVNNTNPYQMDYEKYTDLQTGLTYGAGGGAGGGTTTSAGLGGGSPGTAGTGSGGVAGTGGAGNHAGNGVAGTPATGIACGGGGGGSCYTTSYTSGAGGAGGPGRIIIYAY